MGSQKFGFPPLLNAPDGRRHRGWALLLVILASLSWTWLAACTSGSSGSGNRAAGDTTSTTASTIAPVVEAPDAVTTSQAVGPPAGSRWNGIRRDCGISTPLGDGMAMWFYCDTLRFTAEGDLEFFLNTSVARATPDAPLVMIDQPDRRGDIRPVLEPVPGYPPCSSSQGSFTWPTAAFTEPIDDRRDRVVVYFENVCVVPGVLEGHDVGVAEVIYDLGQPPDPNHPIAATVLEPRLFPRTDDESPFGLAAVNHHGWVYVYRCPGRAAPCEVARTRPDTVAAIDSYRYWTGSGWSEQVDAVAPMVMPDSFEGTKPAVEWIEALDAFVMVNHPLEATGTVRLRAARSPTGPWSAPVVIDLPECEGFYPAICFAAEVHDQLSDAEGVGLTWFDPTWGPGTASPTRFAHVPVSIIPSDG